MQILRLAGAVAVCALCHSEVQAAWHGGKSARYDIYTDASTETVGAFIADLEKFRAAANQLLHYDPDAPGRVRIVVFQYQEDYLRYRPVIAGQLASNRTSGHAESSYFAPGLVASLWMDRQAFSTRIVFHEFTHVLHVSRLARLPLWFNEGLSEYFSTAEVEGDICRFGKIPADRLALVRRGLPLPLGQMFAVAHGQPGYPAAIDRGLYGEAWAFVHYCLRDAESAERKGLWDFLDRLNGGALPSEETFRGAFGIGFAEMEQRLTAYVDTGRFSSPVVKAVAAGNERIEWRTLAKDERELLLTELEVWARLPADGEARLQKFAERNPASLAAPLALAKLAYRRNQSGSAGEALAAVAERPGVEARVPAFASKLLLDDALRAAPFDGRVTQEKADQIRHLAHQALQLDPRCWLAGESLARVEAAAPEPNAANLARAESLVEAMPDRTGILLAIAVIDFRSGRAVAAREGVQRLLAAPGTPVATRLPAAALLKALEASLPAHSPD